MVCIFSVSSRLLIRLKAAYRLKAVICLPSSLLIFIRWGLVLFVEFVFKIQTKEFTSCREQGLIMRLAQGLSGVMHEFAR